MNTGPVSDLETINFPQGLENQAFERSRRTLRRTSQIRSLTPRLWKRAVSGQKLACFIIKHHHLLA
jgi:hypothetical protein